MLEATILVGDAVERLRDLPDGSVQTCVTSPPYWGLRDYGQAGQIGLEETPSEFVERLCQVFDEVWRVLADDGTIWVNLGDSYKPSGNGSTKRGLNERYFGKEFASNKQGAEASHLDRSGFVADVKPKELVGIPWRFAFAMQNRGWYLRQDIIWAKPNPMPESVTDRCTKSHEYIFLMSKNARYYFDYEAIQEEIEPHNRAHYQKYAQASSKTSSKTNQVRNDGNFTETHCGFATGLEEKRRKRSVWNVSTQPYAGAHFAVYPPNLITPCILAGSREGDLVLDPFSGSGTTGEVALTHNRNYVGIELNPEYATLSENRISNAIGMLGKVTVHNA
jgi:DNA modification methylase